MEPPDRMDEDGGTPICDECHVDVNDEPHKRGCPWGDDTDTGYEVAQDIWMETP